MILLKKNQQKAACCIITDHLKTIIFALTDGVEFEPKGRGYVLKKLMKRVCLLSFLNEIKIDKIKKTCEKIIEIYSYYQKISDYYREIIIKITKNAEEQLEFIKKAEEKIKIELEKKITINENDIFFLFDTKGIPLELIYFYLKKRKIFFSIIKLNKLLEKQKQQSTEERKKKKILVF
jgi:alanyl-tRNA synthetase